MEIPDILWGIFFVIVFSIFFIGKYKKHKKSQKPRNKTDHEKEVEIAIEKEKSRRGGPPTMGGMQ
ncbi:hypothetical protein VBD025_14505 [Virgibacillus flavescens]|uniref:hypothetical protein n=1 Tax=Virgibacillus flavescens TaxID=1611422 RepID=UPI003D342A18